MDTRNTSASHSAPMLHRAMVGLCLALIALQIADGISTYLALNTGRAEEQNQLLVAFAHASGLSVIATVVLAKILTACFFAVALVKTKASRLIVSLLGLQVLYMGHTVAMNFYWAHYLS